MEPSVSPAAFCASLHVERSWRNVQPILLLSFSAVAQLLTAQAQQIDALHHQLALVQASVETNDERVEALLSDRIAQALKPLRQQLVEDSAQQQREMVARVLSQVHERYVMKEDVATQLSIIITQVSLFYTWYHACWRSRADLYVTICMKQENSLAVQMHQQVADTKLAMENELRHLLQDAEAKQSETQRQRQVLADQRNQQERERMKQTIEHDIMEKLQRQLSKELSASSRRAKSSAMTVTRGPEMVSECWSHTQQPVIRMADVQSVVCCYSHVPQQDDFVEEDLDKVSNNELQTMETKLSQQLIAWRQELTLSINKKPCRSEVTKLLSWKLDSRTTLTVYLSLSLLHMLS